MFQIYDRIFRRGAPLIADLLTRYRYWYRRLRISENMPSERLRIQQYNSLRQLCNYAHRHVPLFRKLGGSPEFTDVAELPLLHRNTIRHNLKSAISRKTAYIFGQHGYTSGSSGDPVEFFTDRRSDGLRLASRYRFDEWIGLSFGDRQLRIVAEPSRFSRLTANEIQVPLGRVTSKTTAAVISELYKFRPAGLVGQPYSLSLLAETLPENFNVQGLRCVIATGETLLEHQRRNIENAFGRPVINRYGLREISGYIAQECLLRKGLHINSEHVLVEIVQNGIPVPPGRPGSIVITDFHNRVMPLIRYETGDIGALSRRACECGVAWPLLEGIQGRESDFILLKDGSRAPLSIFADELARSFPSFVSEMQFVLMRSGALLVRVVPQGDSSKSVDRIKRYLQARLSNFSVEIASELRSPTAGKRPLLVRE